MAERSSDSGFKLFSYYLLSLFVLTATGLVYKALFALYNQAQFTGQAFTDISYALLWGIRFDLASAAVFSLIASTILWLLIRFKRNGRLRLAKVSLVLLALMLLVQASLQIGDTLYYADAGRHVSYEIRNALADASGLFMTALSQHVWFIVLAYALAFILVYIVMRLGRSGLLHLSPAASSSAVSSTTALLSRLQQNIDIKMLLVILLSLLLVRGGVTGLPQSVISAFKIGDAKQAVAAMNGAYSVVYGAINSSKEIRQLPLSLPGSVDVEMVMRQLYPVIPSFDTTDAAASTKYNLVYILMEGWTADVMSAYGYDKDTTPFFSSLKKKSYAPLGAVAGGNRTTEGIYASFCSQQNPLGATVAQTSLQNNDYLCLPQILRERGWHTAFFQGSHKETSGTGAFAQSLGFSDSFAREDMPAGRYPLNYWGAQDPDIYDFVLNKLDQMPQPFLIGVNTNSTHDIQLPPGVAYRFGETNRAEKYDGVLHFADAAMAEFFDKIKNKPYFDDTIFVLVSDHTTGGKRSSVAAKYYIPGIIYSERHVPAQRIERYVSQRDFSPTVLDILGLPASPSFAGKSFWQEKASSAGDVYFADYYDTGSIGWLQQNRLVETRIDDVTKMKCFQVTGSLSAAAPVACDDDFQRLSINSLAFTAYSQRHLFSGKTRYFYDFANNP